MAYIEENADALNAAIMMDRDFSYDLFAFKTLERSYLLRLNGKVVERPQHMIMVRPASSAPAPARWQLGRPFARAAGKRGLTSRAPL